MQIFVAVVHAIGEDNEGNCSIVARSREELDKKLLEFFNDQDTYLRDNDDERTEPRYSTLDDAQDDFDWNVDEHVVETE